MARHYTGRRPKGQQKREAGAGDMGLIDAHAAIWP
jgi:hypothetical protein